MINRYNVKVAWLDSYWRVKDIDFLRLSWVSLEDNVKVLCKRFISKSKCHSALNYIWCSVDNDPHCDLVRGCSPADTLSVAKARLAKYLRTCKKTIHITVCREKSNTLITVEKAQ